MVNEFVILNQGLRPVKFEPGGHRIMPTLVLEHTVYTLGQLLSVEKPQIALAGRSNVGKSSLVNALAGQKNLAKVSATPGKTRSINFYHVQPQDYYLVDLPGYGYARASHAERRSWAALLEKYLSSCRHLRALALLLDSRLTPQKLDLELSHFARECGLDILPVLTKADKCTQRERAARAAEWADILGIRPSITSSSKKSGIRELWLRLHQTAGVTTAADGSPDRNDDRPSPNHSPDRAPGAAVPESGSSPAARRKTDD